MANQLKETLESNIRKYQTIANELNYFIANNPELSGEEYQAYEKYVTILKKYNISVEEKFCGIPTAFRGSILKTETPYLKIAILVEYDALPDIGHGCGHSASGAISFLAGMALKDSLEGKGVAIDLIGTPDEERQGCKVKMSEEGIFKSYDLAMMVHLNSNETVPSPKFIALGAYKVRFYGKSSHAAAAPWDGVNALTAAQIAFHAIDAQRQQFKPETRVAYYIDEGGKASNIITDFVECQVEFRHSNDNYLSTLKKKIEDCIKGASIATGTTYELETVGYEYKDLLENGTGVQLLKTTLDELEEKYIESNVESGSSDVGNISYDCPTLHPLLATSDYYFSLHTKDMTEVVKSDKANKIIKRGARVIGYTILNLLEDEKHIED